jgi:LruC domain-containing protein
MTEGCQFYKTETGCPNSSQFTFSVTVPFINPIAYNDFPVAPYNPFIFAMPSMYHGDNYYHPGRTLEIHLKNKMPTSKADINMFGDEDDRSNVAEGKTYQTATGLPWALKIAPGASEDWKHPKERIGLLKAYPEFKQFVDTEGEKSSKWFLQRFADTSKVINY